jgi:hypothetical protein
MLPEIPVVINCAVLQIVRNTQNGIWTGIEGTILLISRRRKKYDQIEIV